MAVEPRWLSVGSPSGVGDTGMRVEDLCEIGLLLLDELPQLGDLADLLEGKDLVLLVSIDGQTCRVVATVFEARETCRCGDGARQLGVPSS